MSARHFELIKRPGLIVPEAALRRRHICYSGSKPPACTFTDSSHVTATSGNHTHSGLSFGAANAKRFLVVTLTYNSNNIGALGGVTIGGVSATRLAKYLYNQSGGATVTPSSEIWGALVPTGTSGSVVLPLSGGGGWNSSVAVYAVTGLKSTTPTATTGADDVSHPGTLNMSIAVEAAGITIATMFYCGTGTITAASVSGIPQAFTDGMGSGNGAQTGGTTSSLTAATISTATTFSGAAIKQITGTMASFR